MTDAPYILYIAPDVHDASRFCPGSRAAVDLMEERAMDGVLVQNVQVLRQRGAKLPPWLSGTPTLVDKAQSVAFKGTQAVRRLQELAHADEAARVEERPPEEEAKPEVGGMTAPGQRFLVGEDDDPNDFGAKPEGGAVREGNVSDSDLAAFIAARDAAMPTKTQSP